MKKTKWIALTGFLLAFSCADGKKQAEQGYKMVGYVAGSRMHAMLRPAEAKKLTHINYAFATIENGEVADISDNAPDHLASLNSLKAINMDLKLLISIGGWSKSGGFSDAVLTEGSRQKFANSCLDYLQKNKLDGIDLDWEYPGLPGAGNTHRPEDKGNFTAVLALLRKKLDSLSNKNKAHYLLTIATGASQSYLDHIEMDKIHQYLDFMNIMAYDFHGAHDKATFHHTNLFESQTDTIANKKSAHTAVNEHVAAGAPIEKLVLGVAFYGRGWRGVAPQDNGLHQHASKGGFDLPFRAISDSLKKASYKRHWDTAAKAPYAWSEATASFITYDDKESLIAKSNFIRQKGMGGAMFWEYTADNNGELLQTLYAQLGNTSPPEAEQNGQSNDRTGKGLPLRLFNGKNLDGWYTFLRGRGRNNDPKKVFTVKDGMIRISGEEWGCITTNDEYENYRLVTEFKWGGMTYPPRLENARDCGILLHSQGEDGSAHGIWMTSIECQIIEGGTGDFIVVGDGSDKFQITCTVAEQKQENSFVFQPKGTPVTVNENRINWYGRAPEWKDELDFRGKNDVERPVGEWNLLECEVKGDEITVYLNGVLVNKATDVKPSKGRIQIQSEGAEIFFKRIDLFPL